ncbi:MAG: hypothetical protein GC164_03930 [Phycisphaera sp.]|nr:hypothetical protein [Phycisphaera sp.]
MSDFRVHLIKWVSRLLLVMTCLAGGITLATQDDGDTPSVPRGRGSLISAFALLQDHLDGKNPLDDTQIDSALKTIQANADFMAHDEQTIEAALKLATTYDKVYGPLWVSGRKFNRDDRDNIHPPATDIHWVDFIVMQLILNKDYNSQTLTRYRDLLDGYNFGCSANFPGAVDPPSDPNEKIISRINASNPRVWGRDEKWTAFARRPTGAFLAPGSIATVTVPDGLVGKGFRVRVGGHSYNQGHTVRALRLNSISLTYPIQSREISVANPLGGGIYIEVPVNAAAGVVEVSIRNAVRSPYFTTESFNATSLEQWQKVERNLKAPWADIRSEKFMMLVPTSWIVGLDDPKALLDKWDKAMDICNDLLGLPREQPRESYYISVDIQQGVTGKMKPGYPTGNHAMHGVKVIDGVANNHLLKGPELVPSWFFHELGHNYKFPKYAGEEEAAVNLLHIAVMNKGYGQDLERAFAMSKMDKYNPACTLDNTAVSWMTCTSFEEGLPMDAQLCRYQHQGFAKYVEVVRLYGWDVLSASWKQLNDDFEAGRTSGEHKPDDDELTLRLSRCAGQDLRPLMHFWGKHPQNPEALKAVVEKENLPPSAKVYDTLVHYKTLVPPDNAAFRDFAVKWWGQQPIAKDKDVQSKHEHEQQWGRYNTQSAELARKRVQDIIDLYFPNGRP